MNYLGEFFTVIFRPLRPLPFDPAQGGPSTKAQDGERKSNHEFIEPTPLREIFRVLVATLPRRQT